MDSFLTYLLYRVAYALILAELIIMVVCSIGIIFIKIFARLKARRIKERKEKIAAAINHELFSSTPLENFSLPSECLEFRDLVEEVETFDHRFTDERWTQIKQKIFDKYLHREATQKAKSWYWLSRQMSARALLLCPEKAGEGELRQLLHDKKYLVRIVAAVSITKAKFKELFFEMIDVMSKETKLSQFPYRDALVDVDQEKFKWIENLLSSTKEYNIKSICLDVLSTRVTNDLLPVLHPYFKSENAECRALAIKALGNIPSNESLEILMDHLADSDWELRATSIEGLHKLHATQSIPKLGELLDDPVWWVRLKAALALKDFGVEGKSVLQAQEAASKPMAHEIAQYALALP